ncbi:MAG: GNAT family N-acetyltransferase [Anaerolineae bacterium]|nr:GNAT family N-acetyltransferase [Anaerolineae bacterium]
MIATLETPRLRLRPFTLDDVDAYYAGISSDADVMRYLPGGVPRLRADSQWVISYFMRHAELHGFGVWAVDDKSTAALIGHAGLEYIPGADDVEIAYTLAKAYWGRGLATEAARASLRYGFEALDLDEIYGLAFPANEASQNVMRKLGMAFQGVSDRYYGSTLACYRISREGYFAARADVQNS